MRGVEKNFHPVAGPELHGQILIGVLVGWFLGIKSCRTTNPVIKDQLHLPACLMLIIIEDPVIKQMYHALYLCKAVRMVVEHVVTNPVVSPLSIECLHLGSREMSV